MKKILFHLILLSSSVILFGCDKKQSGKSDSTDSLSKKHPSEATTLSSVQSTSTAKNIVTEVDTSFALSCIREHDSVFLHQKYPLLKFKDLYTHYVEFDSIDFNPWIRDVIQNTDCNKLRVMLGAYSPQIKTSFPGYARNIPNKLPRTTVILWPYNGNKPAKYLNPTKGAEIKPYNLGHINP